MVKLCGSEFYKGGAEAEGAARRAVKGNGTGAGKQKTA